MLDHIIAHNESLCLRARILLVKIRVSNQEKSSELAFLILTVKGHLRILTFFRFEIFNLSGGPLESRHYESIETQDTCICDGSLLEGPS